MPTTLVGLLVFVVFLTPGFVSYIRRRESAPTPTLSPLVETVTLTTVSVALNLVVLGTFGLVRLALPHHTPDVGELLHALGNYIAGHFAYVIGWLTALLTVSSVLAFAQASEAVRRRVPRLAPPVIINVSSWYRMFEAHPDRFVYVGCDLRDGSYMAGGLVWYSTDTNETEDRDLVLGPPLRRSVNGELVDLTGPSRIILSARDIVALHVTYVEDLGVDAPL